MIRLARKAKATSRRSPLAKERTKKKWGWGGARPGAGRPKSPDSGVPHTARPEVDPRHPVQVTLRVREGVPDLRRGPVFRAVSQALEAGSDRFGFRLMHYAIKSGEVQLIAQADDTNALSRGVQGLSVRLARRANAAADRSGKVFGDRYEVRVLKSPAEAKKAKASVLSAQGAVADSVGGRRGRGAGTPERVSSRSSTSNTRRRSTSTTSRKTTARRASRAR
jgi:hypothetical protein